MGREWKIGDWVEFPSGSRFLIWDIRGGYAHGINRNGPGSVSLEYGRVKHLPDCTGWDWEEPKAKEPPPGYRLLTEGDTLIDSDIYLSWDGTWKNCIVSDKIPRGVGPSSTLYARKIETTIEPPPGYRLLGRDDIVDYGYILIARDANNCDLWKAVDGDKYGNTVGYFVDTYHIAAFARKIEPKPVEPLKGYRLMNGDETIRHGDMFWQSGSWKDTVIGVSEISVEAALKKYARYRITAYARKIEPKYRPFASAAEFEPYAEKWIGRFEGCVAKPGAWRPIGYSDEGIYPDSSVMKYSDAFELLKFKDGTPFGVLES